MPHDRSAEKFGPFTKSLPVQTDLLSQTCSAPRQTDNRALLPDHLTDRTNTTYYCLVMRANKTYLYLLFCYESTHLLWFVIFFPLMGHLFIGLVMAKIE